MATASGFRADILRAGDTVVANSRAADAVTRGADLAFGAENTVIAYQAFVGVFRFAKIFILDANGALTESIR